MERNRGGRPRHPDVLTPAEWRVLDALREGGTNAEIAARLGISPDAVKYHISNMLGKLGLQGRHELAAWRPAAERRRLGAVFAVPAALAYVVRPLVWVGLGTAAAASVAVGVVAAVAVVAVVLVGVPGSGEPSVVARLPVATPEATSTPPPTPTDAPSPAATPTPTPSATPSATPQPTLSATPSATPTPEPSGPVMRYDRFDPSGEASTPGSYAFLMPDGDATRAVETYEELRTETTVMRVHTTDANGVSHAAFYDAVEAGDLFEWHESDDCFVRYTVTEVMPDPGGAEPRKLLAVEWMTYAFTGCSGSVNASASVSVKLGPLPHLGGTDITAPVVHGVYQIVPVGWTGATKASVRSERSTSYPPEVGTADITVARTMRYWRDPAVPAGWVFYGAAGGGDELQAVDGYCASWVTETGDPGFDVCGKKGHRIWFGVGEGSWHNGASRFETRVVAGRPASVIYSVGDAYFPLAIRVYDPATDVEYTIWGEHRSVLGWQVDALIAIAEGMFAE